MPIWLRDCARKITQLMHEKEEGNCNVYDFRKMRLPFLPKHPIGNQHRAVVEPPNNESPGSAVPETREKEAYTEIEIRPWNRMPIPA